MVATVLDASESEYFFESVLPGMVHLALSLPSLVQSAIPLLRRRRPASISLTQKQVASLLANAFFCTFPRRNTAREPSEYSTFPDINFNRLFQGHKWKPKAQIAVEKLKCLIHYFRQVCSKDPLGVVTFARRYCPESLLPKWPEAREIVPRLHVSATGRIEDEGYGMLQVDFANKFVGGGVLGTGCVQEEIQFLIFPELIVSRLFTEALDRTEALVVSGCERYSVYKGYSETFRWAGGYDPKKLSPNSSVTARDVYGRHLTSIVAIDALNFSSPSRQYSQDALLREVNKAYVGFSCPEGVADLPAVATGNWGCGVFHGDAQLKALLQLMAAAKAKRDLVYFTFGNEKLRDDIDSLHKCLYNNKIPIGELWQHLCHYYTHCYQDGSFSSSLYTYLYSVLEEPAPANHIAQQNTSINSSSDIKMEVPSGGSAKVGSSGVEGVEEDASFTREDLDQLEESIKAYYADEQIELACVSNGGDSVPQSTGENG
ncbi:poly(ADP-ribose) glycohydrolase-like isoform X2 [Hetaerina americana]|uniref:poly(ADP-ribose) glycohydrolase-like isoform X2 n=1 Tax=Hetaerina americana TaxID=62018 RepID=UPI003A7F403A